MPLKRLEKDEDAVKKSRISWRLVKEVGQLVGEEAGDRIEVYSWQFEKSCWWSKWGVQWSRIVWAL